MIEKRKLLGITAPLLLAGCQLSTLPNGESSRMGTDYNQLRSSLTINSTASISLPSYQPVSSCQYTLAITPSGGQTINQTVNISVKPVPNSPDDLQVIETTADGAISDYLIDKNSGTLLDFNAIDPITGQRYTPESADAMAQSAMASLPNAQVVRDPHYLNGFSMFMPQFTGSSFNQNDVASNVNEEDGSPWAEYVYRGTVTYNGAGGDLFDLMRSVPSVLGNGPVLVGFMIFDPNTMTPIISTLDSGTKVEFNRVQCTQ